MQCMSRLISLGRRQHRNAMEVRVFLARKPTCCTRIAELFEVVAIPLCDQVAGLLQVRNSSRRSYDGFDAVFPLLEYVRSF